MAGPMAEYAGANNTGWRNFWWLNVGLIGATLLLCLVGFPKTKSHHIHPDEMRKIQSRAAMSNGDRKMACETTNGTDMGKLNSPELPDLSHSATAQPDHWLGKDTPSKQQFKLFQSYPHPFKSILLDL